MSLSVTLAGAFREPITNGTRAIAGISYIQNIQKNKYQRSDNVNTTPPLLQHPRNGCVSLYLTRHVRIYFGIWLKTMQNWSTTLLF